MPVEIPEGDDELLAQCRIETFRAGGPGGQHQNKTDSAVRLVHLPTGTRVVARDERSQSRNRALALRRLRSRLKEEAYEPPPRKATRVPRAEKKRRKADKRRRGEIKKLRKPPDPNRD